MASYPFFNRQFLFVNSQLFRPGYAPYALSDDGPTSIRKRKKAHSQENARTTGAPLPTHSDHAHHHGGIVR
jgi:hypothetical protein